MFQRREVPRHVFNESIVGPRDRIKQHFARTPWYRTTWNTSRIKDVRRFTETPRILLDRDLFRDTWIDSVHLPESDRWERVINGQRVTEDRYFLVEDEGELHPINWRVYSERVNKELQESMKALPQFTQVLVCCPVSWKKLDVSLAMARGMSVREAKVQLKLGGKKQHQIIYRCLELAEHGAVNEKGLERDKLRIAKITCYRDRTDVQVDIRSKGFFNWKTKRNATMLITVAEDQQMKLPDRTKLPWWVQDRLARNQFPMNDVTLDVPALSSEGI
ncbi:50S ribosomal protein L22 [Perkinsela sp. CCAP 1560/4]|nr:50S ribosomal protein L22 [Perkinsela sp. CCAP 1560/4]KNH09118.1 50S ribosomal protein L22 [Perkinsela sp. CCAP 1560/4]|eukprot:KNH01385.1 50S ribosomal protein L22 [Perkinsela sp. CCAP 1560/4]